MKKKMFFRNEEVKTNFLFVFQTTSKENFHFFGRNFSNGKALTKNVEATRGKIKNIVNSVLYKYVILIDWGQKKNKLFFEREDSKKLLGDFVYFSSEISGGGLGTCLGWIR